MAAFEIICKGFEELTPHELYDLLRLRSEVFVVEQHCVFLDADNKDPYCYHVLVKAGSRLAATARVVPPGVSYEEMSVGRVASAPAFRGQGAGRAAVAAGIEACVRLFGPGPIRIGAQVYLKRFYESFGFVQDGAIYVEDEIDHLPMLRPR